MQGLKAIIREWAQNVADSAPADAIADNTSVPNAWPISWGSAGEQSEGAPYALALQEHYPNQWAARNQRQSKLQPAAASDFTSSLFHAMGSDAEQGFQIFEKYHAFAVWRVPVPDFPAATESDGSHKRVPIQTAMFKRGFLPLAVVLQLRAATEFVVCYPNCACLLHVVQICPMYLHDGAACFWVTTHMMQETEFEGAGIRQPSELREFYDSLAATVPVPPPAGDHPEDSDSDSEGTQASDLEQDEDIPSSEPSTTRASIATVGPGPVAQSSREARIAARAKAADKRKTGTPNAPVRGCATCFST